MISHRLRRELFVEGYVRGAIDGMTYIMRRSLSDFDKEQLRRQAEESFKKNEPVAGEESKL